VPGVRQAWDAPRRLTPLLHFRWTFGLDFAIDLAIQCRSG